MALDYEVPEDKRALYWLGDQLIEWRNPIMILVILVTGLFAYWTFQLRLVTSFGDLVPQSHEFVKIHNKYSGTFGGANNIVVMYTVKEGTIFTKEHLTNIFKMTEGMDTVYGVNHNQIESIGHRTVRHLKVAAGGTLRAEPVMLRAPQGQDEVDEIRRIVHNAENVYGLIVSLDDKAALIRANFIEGRLDYQRIFEEINNKVLAEGGEDILSLLLEATDEDGATLSKRHIRDEVMTLMFAGHDTTTSTVAFLFHELARNPGLADDPSFDLGQAIDETLRLYPPAWIGPRRSIEPFAFAGMRLPGGVPVNYCSWASHRLPDVWPDPDAFRSERFAPGNRERIAKGAYVPFGGGSRMCIGMRFGLAEVGVIAAAILERFRLELAPDYRLVTRQMPTIGPKHGMPMVPRAAKGGPVVAEPALAA